MNALAQLEKVAPASITDHKFYPVNGIAFNDKKHERHFRYVNRCFTCDYPADAHMHMGRDVLQEVTVPMEAADCGGEFISAYPARNHTAVS